MVRGEMDESRAEAAQFLDCFALQIFLFFRPYQIGAKLACLVKNFSIDSVWDRASLNAPLHLTLQP